MKRFCKRFCKGFWLILRYGPAKVADWHKESNCDEITELNNWRFLLREGKRELAKAKRLEKSGMEYSISVISADIRKFKAFNDEEGHLAGNEVLCKIAALLRKVFREVDIVCRVGGDEFVVLLPETTIEGARVALNRLQEALKELRSPGGREVILDCGVTEVGKASLEELLQKADAAMYKAKKGLKP